jgi:hypothetical protein
MSPPGTNYENISILSNNSLVKKEKKRKEKKNEK